MNKAANCALVLIALALSGAGVSYHFTLEARFAALQQKLDQNAVALQQCEITQETAASSKTDALNNLSKEVDTLQNSLEPLGKSTQEQTASLAEIRKQIAAIEQSQQAQQDAQKKLTEFGSQIDSIKHDVAVHAIQASLITPASAVVATAPTTVTKPVDATPAAVSPTVSAEVAPAVAKPLPVAQPVSAPVALPVSPRASAVGAPLPVAPRADSAIDIRPDESIRTASMPVEPLPAAVPVALNR